MYKDLNSKKKKGKEKSRGPKLLITKAKQK